MRARRGRLRDRLGILLLPRAERRAAVAERRAEEALERERYPAVCLSERRRAALEAERRRCLGVYGEWRF